jgi:uncharacterized metal-binding protein YceD (DUF177 family)
MTADPEFSRPVPADRIGTAGTEHHVEATAAECAALAARLRVPAVRALACTFRLKREPGGRIAATGRLTARLLRDCVVTLDAFETGIAETFAVVFVPEASLSPELDLESADEIPCAGGLIDLGEAAAEQVALTLDPYPRRAGAALTAGEAEPAASPFAVLVQKQHDG